LDIAIDEVEVKLGPIPRETIVICHDGGRQSNWPNYTHSLLQLTSIKTETRWIFDICGGQYGIYKPFWTRSEYKQYYFKIGESWKVYPHGTNKAYMHAFKDVRDIWSMTYGVVGEVAKAMDVSIIDWEKSFDLKLSTLVSSGDDKSTDYKASLLTAMETAVRNFMRSYDMKSVLAASQVYETTFPGRRAIDFRKIRDGFWAAHLPSIEH